jgi:hypothetical protein
VVRKSLEVLLLLSKLLLQLQELLLLPLPDGEILGSFLSALEGIPVDVRQKRAPSLATGSTG